MRIVGSKVHIKRTPKAGTFTEGGLLISDLNVTDEVVAEVLAVGPGEWLPFGEQESMAGIKPGDRVICYPGYGHELGNHEYIVDITEIEGVIRS